MLWDYAEAHETLVFSEIFEFDWDIAYYDSKTYSRGEHLKEQYSLEFDVEPMMSEELGRFLFFYESNLIHEYLFDRPIMPMILQGDAFYPGTVFTVRWFTRQGSDNQTYRYLELTEQV